ERDAHARALQRPQRGAERPTADRVDDQIVLGLLRNLVAHDHLVSAELAERRHVVGPTSDRGHVGARQPSELDREITDASGRAGDEHALAEERTTLARASSAVRPATGNVAACEKVTFAGSSASAFFGT